MNDDFGDSGMDSSIDTSFDVDDSASVDSSGFDFDSYSGVDDIMDSGGDDFNQFDEINTETDPAYEYDDFNIDDAIFDSPSDDIIIDNIDTIEPVFDDFIDETETSVLELSSDVDEIMDAGEDDFSQFEIQEDLQEDIDDKPKVLTRNPDDLRESGYSAIENNLEAIRDDYRDKGMSDGEEMEALIEQERESLQQEFEQDAFNYGETGNIITEEIESEIVSPEENITPEIEIIENADNIESIENIEATTEIPDENIDSATDINSILETGEEDFSQFENEVQEENAEIDETQINYDEILEGIEQDSLNEGFSHIDIDNDPERLTSSLDNFHDETWQGLSLDEQKDSMRNLADYVVDTVGFENPPIIEYYNNERLGDYGGYDHSTNTLSVNEYMLYDSAEAADTIAHELWHAYQHERSISPQNARDYQYQYNFENYIPPDLGQEAYENQLVEAEARAFASRIKDRLK